MKRLSLLIVCILIFTSTMITACGNVNSGQENGDSGEKQTYEFRLASVNTTNALDTMAMEDAAKQIEEKTNGDVKVTVYPANQLGDYVQMYDEVIAGTVDMVCIPIPTTYTDLGALSAMPYLASNYDQYKIAFGKDSYFYNKMNEIQAEQGVKALGYISGGFMGIGAVKIDPDTVFDFGTKKNTLVRIGDFAVTRKVMDGIGYNITTIPFTDTYAALQTGVADAFFGCGAQTNYEGFKDVIKYYIDYQIMDDTFMVAINEKTFNSLPEEYQTVISDVMTSACNNATDQRAATEEEYLQKMRDYGIQVIVPTEEQKKEMVSYVRTNIWPELNDIFGKENIDGLKADLGM